MKKRFLTCLLCTALVLSSGCNKTVAESIPDSDKTTSESTENQNNSTTQNQNTTDTENAVENSNTTNTVENSNTTDTAEDSFDSETTDKITENTSSQLYSVVSKRHTESISSDDDDSIVLMYSDYNTLEIQGDGYDALKNAVNKWQESNLVSLENSIHEYTDYAKEESVDHPDFYGYSLTQTYEIMRSDNHVLSILENYDEYTGGAHPSYYKSGINFDATTGELLTLENIALNSDEFSQKAISYILDYLKNSDIGQNDGFYEDYENIVKENFFHATWYFTGAGITIVYNPYDIAPYAAGSIEITLPSADFEVLLKEEYHTGSTIGYTYVPQDNIITYYSNTTGNTHTISITNEVIKNDDGYEDNTPYIILDGNRTAVGEWGSWSLKSYLIQQNNGRILFAFENSFMSDDYETKIYDITDGTLKEFGSVYSAISIPGTNILTLNTSLYVLGTYGGYRTYDISGNSGIQPLEVEYTIPAAYATLTTIKELPVTNSAQEKILLPVGTVLKPVATDVDHYIRLKDIATEEEYTIHFTREDYTIMIDGVDEYQYFEMIPYAG